MIRILRIALIPAIAAVLALVGVGAAYASTNSLPPNSLVARGVVSNINTSVTPPTATIAPDQGSPVTVSVVGSTVITKAGVGTIGLSDLATGNSVVAVYDKTTLEASSISVKNPFEQREHESLVGTIQSIGPFSFVLSTKHQGNATVTIDANTKYNIPSVSNATFANFKAGDRVAVVVWQSTSGNLAIHVNLIPGKALGIAKHEQGRAGEHEGIEKPKNNGKASGKSSGHKEVQEPEIR